MANIDLTPRPEGTATDDVVAISQEIVQLYGDENHTPGNERYPVTVADAVITSNGKTLAVEFSEEQAARTTAFNTSEAQRTATFNSKEAERDAAMATIESEAETLTELSLKVNEFEPLVEQIPSKADMDGHYDGMSVGAAENLIGKGNPYEGETFTTRVSGGSHAIEDGIAEIRKIKGNTIKWSQLIGQLPSTKTENGVTFTKDSQKRIIANGTPTSGNAYISFVVSITNGHKYFFSGTTNNAASATTFNAYGISLGSTNINDRGEYIATAVSTATTIVLRIMNGYTANNVVFAPQLFDLTEMFGSGNEPTSVAEFRAYFPNSYYPYSGTKLLNFLPNSISSKGRNLWNETWEGGAVNLDTGIIEANANYIRSKEYIPIVGNPTKLRVIKEAAKAMRVLFYDGSFKYLGYTSPATSEARNTINVTSGAKYVKFYYLGSTYNNNISLFYDLTLNDYEPYEVHEMPLHIDTIKDADGVAVFPNGLLSAGTAYDEITKTHAVQRIGKVDLGTLTWNYEATNNFFFLTTGVTQSIFGRTLSSTETAVGNFNVICPKYNYLGRYSDSQMASAANGMYAVSQIKIKDTNYSDAAAFKTAMNGVYLYFELTTPKVIDFASELNLDYEVFTNGVEELKPLTDENGNPSTSPIIADIVYGIDYVNTIESNKAKVANHETRITTLEGITKLENTNWVCPKTSGNTCVANPFKDGEIVIMKTSIANTNWTRFAFSKTQTTDWSADGLLKLIQTQTIGEYKKAFATPSPSEYPYILYAKGATENSITLKSPTSIAEFLGIALKLE